jgi:hypothetical protein
MMLVNIIRRARQLIREGVKLEAATMEVDHFLRDNSNIEKHLDKFCRMDDHDIMASIKKWIHHEDRILALLSKALFDRDLYKVKLASSPFPESMVEEKKKKAVEKYGLSENEIPYFVFTGQASNTTYDPGDERIRILFKDGSIRDISDVDNALIQHNLSGAVQKHYICFTR